MGMRWAYGVTTVPERRADLLPSTLASLAAAGFDKPRLFIDGCKPSQSDYESLGLETTYRWPKVRAYGNWILALAELYIREPNMERYAIFQDDLVTYRNLRTYLERTPYPDPCGYCNLYTFPSNQLLAPRVGAGGRWYLSNQNGRGAVGLVFSLPAVLTLLTYQGPALSVDELRAKVAARHMVERPMDAGRGWRSLDGGVIEAMKKAGWKEWVHNPSLVQHTGKQSMIEASHDGQRLAVSFRGENYDALAMLENGRL